MAIIVTKRLPDEERDEVSLDWPMPVEVVPRAGTTLGGTTVAADYVWRLAQQGRVYTASDSAEDQTVTGQTSFANTTPTFLLRVPSGVVAVPLGVDLGQTGSVAGGAVQVVIAQDNQDRYASGGTAETIFQPNRMVDRPPLCALYSGATATAGYGVRLWGATIGQDVSPAEGAVPGPFWAPRAPLLLVGPAALLVFTWAGTTGPTWFWTVSWAELTPQEVGL